MLFWLGLIFLIFVAGELGETHLNDKAAIELFVSFEAHRKVVNCNFEQLPYFLRILFGIVVSYHANLWYNYQVNNRLW